MLRATEFVAVKQHRNALREKQRRQEVALLARPLLENRGVIRLALCPEVERAVMALAIIAVLTVRIVVLLVVRDEVTQREAIVSCNKIDGCNGPTSGVLVEVG